MEIIKLRDIEKVYGQDDWETKALKNINITIKKGDLVAIIGPSGSGKSTLLNILGCIDKQTNGDYFLDGESVSSLSQIQLAKVRNKKIGFIFQNFNLLYDYSLIDNVALPLSYSENKKNMNKRSVEMLTRVGLEGHINKTPDKLSGGQKQRVAIARALINNPEIISADEPTGALDIETSKMIIEMLKKINKDGKTVIIITHDVNVARECNRIIEIRDGEVFTA